MNRDVPIGEKNIWKHINSQWSCNKAYPWIWNNSKQSQKELKIMVKQAGIIMLRAIAPTRRSYDLNWKTMGSPWEIFIQSMCGMIRLETTVWLQHWKHIERRKTKIERPDERVIQQKRIKPQTKAMSARM